MRIEDDALITAKGCELLTRGVPVAADEIEALCVAERNALSQEHPAHLHSHKAQSQRL